MLATLGARPLHAAEVKVAVAANFRAPAEVLRERFAAQTGHALVLTFGSTSSLFAQVRNGASFDVFLAADTQRPAALLAEGRAKARCTYAQGRLGLLGRAGGAPAQLASLFDAALTHVALAKPEAAPYGQAAREVLERLGAWEPLRPKLVYGESVAQAYQFVHGGGAELAFVAWSQVLAQRAPEGAPNATLVPLGLHAPIRQDAVLLSEAPAARAFFEWLQSPDARALIVAAGYGDHPPTLATPAVQPPETRDASTPSAWPAIRLTLALATSTTLILLLAGTPLAWWLARGRSRWRVLVEALVALPLVLPPTVLGFYLLVLLGPQGPLGALWEGAGGPRLVFSFGGLVIGSVLFSLPFVVQPLRNGFQAIDASLLDAAATLGASRADLWRSVILPLARPSLITAAVLGFAHTVGEFGVVLMIGGSVPGRTQVLSIAIFEHAEQLEFARAHALAGGMLVFAFATLLVVYALNRRFERVTL